MSSPADALKAHDARARRAQNNVEKFKRLVAHNALVLKLEKSRADKLRKKLVVDGERARAVRWALNAVGVVEHPPASNKGPRITAWQELCGYPGAGEPWCQCFAANSFYFGSHNTIDPKDIGGYTVSVVDRAKNHEIMGGRKGWDVVSLDKARRGDWVYFDFDGTGIEHVGVYLSHDASTVTCCEGNTSKGNGSQSNGGGVFVKTRSRSVVAAVVAVPFKD
jgi:hypothetical protein